MTRARAALKYIILALSGHMDDIMGRYKVLHPVLDPLYPILISYLPSSLEPLQSVLIDYNLQAVLVFLKISCHIPFISGA